MTSPSPLVIATKAVERLLNEEASYHKELSSQERAVEKLEEKLRTEGDSQDGNEAFMLKQYQTAIDQTKAVFGPLKRRIDEALASLENQIDVAERVGAANDAVPPSELAHAKSALKKANREPVIALAA